MWAVLSRVLERWQIWRYKMQRAAPRSIEKQAREVAHLADLAALAVLPEQDLTPLRLLKEEMEALAVVARDQEFAKLPIERRFALAERLDRTQQLIITTLHEGIPPTQRRQ